MNNKILKKLKKVFPSGLISYKYGIYVFNNCDTIEQGILTLEQLLNKYENITEEKWERSIHYRNAIIIPYGVIDKEGNVDEDLKDVVWNGNEKEFIVYGDTNREVLELVLKEYKE